MSSALEPGAGAAVTGLFLGSLAIAGAVALVTAPITPRMAVAQTVASPHDQPKAITLPSGAPIMRVGSDSRVDPLDHIFSRDRRDAARD